ncbi:tRNA (adenosine(37)-N6)-dimethylallyltransferase MiaA [Flavimarina sp. Hel_I_48]|uniref:tRNA (adenosine(37)-N6)-dimethylallyltransferase MiaA n=1 Tax=Flavimarina sp. Hel_I_48 TaxID=1392488 RepID=UPI0004DF19DA|nr:tRNA (adenosine(37)-N6)-dimethylallyltransferase MiaA [Flavimarina sp. Hel_I_48]
MDKLLVAVVGPTAIGKTALAIKLAKHYDTEILSADSRQFFKEMKIGTAVPSEEELQQAKHHFIQHISITENYSVGHFEKDALNTLTKVFEKKNIAVLVGGSGLYVDAVLQGLDNLPRVDPAIREMLNTKLAKEGLVPLQKMLLEKDPVHYESIDLNNPQRLLRALEVCISTEKPFSSFLNRNNVKRPFKGLKIGLSADREIIYDRINKRVDIMMENGLEEEVLSLVDQKDRNALNTVGYKELFAHFDGKITKTEAISEIKKNTRRFAKRQLTWYRKDQSITWFDKDYDLKKIINVIDHHIN